MICMRVRGRSVRPTPPPPLKISSMTFRQQREQNKQVGSLTLRACRARVMLLFNFSLASKTTSFPRCQDNNNTPNVNFPDKLKYAWNVL